jgi:hypothetical protein
MEERKMSDNLVYELISILETKFFDIFLSTIFFSRQGRKEDVGKEDVRWPYPFPIA